MPTSTFQIDKAQIVALFTASVFYGILVSTFINCISVLLWSKSEHGLNPLNKINFKMLIPALVMFIFASLDVAYGLRQNIEAFIQSGGNAIAAFDNTSNWLVYMKMVDYVVQTFIGDGILIYRCWIVYNGNWLIVICPILMWVAGTGCGIVTCFIEASLVNNLNLLNASKLVPFITSMLTLTLVTNLFSTSLIVYRIWSVQKAATNPMPEKTGLSRVMRVLIESGLMYTASIIILFVTYLTSNNAQFPVSDAVVQIIGITFNLIIIRVHDNQILPSVPDTSRFRSTHGSVPLNSVQIQTKVSQYTRRDDIVSTPPSPLHPVIFRSPDYKTPAEWRA